MRRILLSPWLALVTLLVVLAVRYVDYDFISSVRLKYFDQLIISQPIKDIPVSVVNIDEDSLSKYGQFPFPRKIYAEIIEDLYKREAGLVVFNVMMPEADRFGGDSILAKTLENRAVVLPQVASTVSKNKTFGSPVQVIGDHQYRMVEYPGVIANVEVLEERAAGVGVVNTFPEIDGVVRRLPLVIASGDTVHPAIALQTLMLAVGDTKIQVRVGDSGVEALRIPKFGKIPVDGLGRVWIDASNRAAQHSLTDLPESFGGRIVVVGVSAAGLVQPVASSRGEIWPQDLQAGLLGTMLNKTNIVRSDSADLWELALIATFGVLLLLLTRWMYVGIATMVVVVVGSVAGSIWAYGQYYYLIDATAFSVGIVLVALHAYVVKFLSEYFQKQQIKAQFGSYVNPVIVERLQKNPEFIKLGGETRELSIIFTDMRNFSGLGESFGDDVQGFTKILNRYMTAITEPVMRNNGCLIKFIGDATVHVHGAPIQEQQDPDHVLAAVRTGLEMIEAVEKFNIKLADEGKPPVGMGVGVNTGITLIGNIGSETHFAYDILGDSVSLTARLEGQTKNYGVLIIISGATQARIGDEYFTLELDKIAVKGKTVGVNIFTVFYNPDITVAADWIMARETHEEMLALYRAQQWDDAIDLCQELTGEFDGRMGDYYSLWIERIAEMRTRDLPADWSGVFIATSK